MEVVPAVTAVAIPLTGSTLATAGVTDDHVTVWFVTTFPFASFSSALNGCVASSEVSVAEPGDTVATSAAGAMPFYSGLPTFDLLGIASPEVIREGNVLFNRPGHTRTATGAQIERHSPTFFYLGGGGEGYEEIYVDVGDGFTVGLIVKKERVAKLIERPEVRRPPKP
jgi:hypothetical protein